MAKLKQGKIKTLASLFVTNSPVALKF